jgi:adenylate cyclase class 2
LLNPLAGTLILLPVPIEIEKKYRLTEKQRDQILLRLKEVGATAEGEEFEENTLFTGDALPRERCVLRLRRVNGRATLTFKQRITSGDSIKHQQEDETTVGDADAMEAILDSLGLTPRLVYEKRRATFRLGGAEIVVDELPFGLFMEIEGTEAEIKDAERQLAIKGLKAEHSTYPQLTQRHGKSDGQIVAARFPDL